MENNILLGSSINLGQLTQMKSRQSSTLTTPSKNDATQAFDGILKNKMSSNEPKVALRNKSSLNDIKETVRQSSLKGNKSNVVKAEVTKNDSLEKSGRLTDVQETTLTAKTDENQPATMAKDTKETSMSGTDGVEGKKNLKEAEMPELPEDVKKMIKDMENVLNFLESILAGPDLKALEELTQIAVEMPKGTDVKAVVQQMDQLITKVLESVQKISTQLDTTQMNGPSAQKLSEMATKMKVVLGDLQKLMTTTFEKADLKGFGEQLKDALSSLKTDMGSIQQAYKAATDTLKGSDSNQTPGNAFDSLLKEADANGNKANQNVLHGKQENAFESKLAQNAFGKTNLSQEGVKESKTNANQSAPSGDVSQVRFENSMISFSKQNTQVSENRVEMFKNIMEQMVSGVKTQLKQTETGSSMTLKLSPEHLGNVEVKLEITKGTVLAEFKVENQMVKAALEANLSDLKSALSDKGYQVENLDIHVDKDGRQQKNQQHEQQQGQNKQEENSKKDSSENNAFNSFYEALNIIG